MRFDYILYLSVAAISLPAMATFPTEQVFPGDDCLNATVKVRERPRVVAVYQEGDELPAKERESDIRVVLVSDTHNVEIPASLFPEGDLLLHAGDHTIDGTREELQSASDWLRKVAAHYKYGCVTIGGNHDLPLDAESFLDFPITDDWSEAEIRNAPARWFTSENPQIRYLQHEALTIAGLTIFGSPYVPLSPTKHGFLDGDPRRRLGFSREDRVLAELYAKIPHCDILMTHPPAFGLLDLSVQYGGVLRATPVLIGSKVLRERLSNLEPQSRPALHVFGHEHDSRGVLFDDKLGIYFVNAAAVNGDRRVLREGGTYTAKPGFRATVVDFRIE